LRWRYRFPGCLRPYATHLWDIYRGNNLLVIFS
jgi:hypothetical protein